MGARREPPRQVRRHRIARQVDPRLGEARRTGSRHLSFPFRLHQVYSHQRISQLFLEEERERELEALYETGIADALNRADAPIGSGAPDADPSASAIATAESAGVSKQTTETLMAGERIMEALDLADAELETFREYEEEKRKGGLAATVAPPPRNAVLAAYDVEPEEWVLRVVEKVPGTALYDALLVLPFGKVISLMRYLNVWAQRVRSLFYLFHSPYRR